MAQRLLLRRFLTSVISRKPPQGVWASLTSTSLQTPPYNAGGLTGTPSPARTFHTWCGPCKILGPRLEKMVAKQHGKVVMAKVDIDDHTDLAIEYEVSAVPTVLAIKNGDVVDKFVGIKDEDQLEAFLKKLIG
ncbi:thioredoxin 2, isoform CRA_a [Rattus norvegicus]|uniref:Thioredoxin 2, isoform CRA_a n=1 Tax=Rattus norvegicus TaxID=10116 RepID=A6HSH1_RAT|nr:thioredoxin 2, isoform CRA_a [Rattus norvegicus]